VPEALGLTANLGLDYPEFFVVRATEVSHSGRSGGPSH